jgi:osmoprotectant transport system ATP-binding protein
VIEFEQVVKQFPDGTVAVDHLDLVVPNGKITVMVGPSGCGKTTSLRMINRMIDATSGTISIDGRDVAKSDPADLRRSIGYVIQHAGLFPHRTIEDNIATVPVLTGAGRREARTRAGELMELVGLPAAYAKRYPVQLSGGQQQRVGVARALAADPPVMLMDEPFSAVDPVVREGLQQEFLRLQSDLGKTIAFVTHDIDEAIRLGDQVAVFAQGGRLAQVASPAELLAHPADDFVAGFVGRDRGFRGLSFASADSLPTEPLETRVDGAVLDLDASGRPQAWVREGERLELGGTYGSGDTLRTALDLAITSPVGAAVRIGPEGKAEGVCRHETIAEHLRHLPAHRPVDEAG